MTSTHAREGTLLWNVHPGSATSTDATDNPADQHNQHLPTLAVVDGLRASCGQPAGTGIHSGRSDDPLTALAALAALAATLGLTPAWTLPGQLARWTGHSVDLVADDASRGSGVHVVPADDTAPVRTFDPDDDPAAIADAVRAAGPHHTTYSEPHAVHGTWTSPATCHPNRAAADARVDAVTALAGPGAAGRRTWTVSPCDGTCR